jgi:hypothetical protein
VIIGWQLHDPPVLPFKFQVSSPQYHPVSESVPESGSEKWVARTTQGTQADFSLKSFMRKPISNGESGFAKGMEIEFEDGCQWDAVGWP